MNIRDMADELIAQDDELRYLRAEVKRLRKVEDDYSQFVRESVRAGELQMCGWMDLLLRRPALLKETKP